MNQIHTQINQILDFIHQQDNTKVIKTDRDIVCYFLYSKALESIKSVVVLINHNCFIDAYCLIRILYENIIKLAFLLNSDDQTIETYIDSSDIELWAEYLYFNNQNIDYFTPAEKLKLQQQFTLIAKKITSSHKNMDLDSLEDFWFFEKAGFRTIGQMRYIFPRLQALPVYQQKDYLQTMADLYKDCYSLSSGAIHSSYRTFTDFYIHQEQINTAKAPDYKLKAIYNFLGLSLFIVPDLMNDTKVLTFDINAIKTSTQQLSFLIHDTFTDIKP